MGRTDIRALEVPEPPRAFSVEAQVEHSPVVRPERELPIASKPVETKSARPSRCPKCNAGLSDIEAKFGRCMGCGTSLAGGPGGAINVGI